MLSHILRKEKTTEKNHHYNHLHIKNNKKYSISIWKVLIYPKVRPIEKFGETNPLSIKFFISRCFSFKKLIYTKLNKIEIYRETYIASHGTPSCRFFDFHMEYQGWCHGKSMVQHSSILEVEGSFLNYLLWEKLFLTILNFNSRCQPSEFAKEADSEKTPSCLKLMRQIINYVRWQKTAVMLEVYDG